MKEVEKESLQNTIFHSGNDASILVALACSTGGPKSLQEVIPYLPADLDAGMVIVQHMPKGFTASLAKRLDETSKIQVKEAQDGEAVCRGCVYIAPGGLQLRLSPSGKGHRIRLSDEPPVDGLRPCANLMYESLEHCNFEKIICVVLTGMGADGTKGIKGLAALHKKMVVLAQDEESSIVYGMPKAVTQAGLVDEVIPLSQAAQTIITKVGVS